MQKKKDIVIFLSDQHSGKRMGFLGDSITRTPNMDKLAAEGCSFTEAYTSCPLCVPARTSMLTGLLPSKTGVFTNDGTFSSDKATFLTALAAGGYETVLCGRMHFMGPDQRHGFTRRIGEDICPTQWGFRGDLREDLGILKGTMNEQGCLKAVGTGNSNVLDYDRQITDLALNYLREEHEKPQCLVVGTYGPHFPYVAPRELFLEYRKQVTLPETLVSGIDYELPMIEHRQRDLDIDLYLDVQAAYCSMISYTDSLLGEVRDQWIEYLSSRKREGLFVYLSDHGDQAGERRLFAKQTFFDSASKIPLIIQGYGIEKNKRIDHPVSIMDLGITLCDLVGVEYNLDIDGISRSPFLNEKMKKGSRDFVLSELLEIDKSDKNPETCSIVPGRMIRSGFWKLIVYSGYQDFTLLFNLDDDPDEQHNLTGQFPDIESELMTQLLKDWDPAGITEQCRSNLKHYKLLHQWGRETNQSQNEMWSIDDPSRYSSLDG